MKKEYMKPSMTVELQHMTLLLAGSGDVRDLQSSGWDDPEDDEDELNLSDLGGGSSIWDR